MKAELAEEEAKAQWNTAKVLLRSDAAAAAADIVCVKICSLHWDTLTSVRRPHHNDLSISHQHLTVLTQEEGESLRERNDATTTALKAASAALSECQAQLDNYESQVRCLTAAGPAVPCRHEHDGNSCQSACGSLTCLGGGLALISVAALL